MALMGAQCFTDLKLIVMALRYHLCAISVLVAARNAACPYPCFLAKLVPFDEIFINPSDLKHVGKLLGRSDGLGVVITTRSRHLFVFY